MAKNEVEGGGQYSAPGGALAKDQTKKDLAAEKKASEDRKSPHTAGYSSTPVVGLF
jgi:hypothetical protein